MSTCLICTHDSTLHRRDSMIADGMQHIFFVCNSCGRNCSEEAGRAEDSDPNKISEVDLVQAREIHTSRFGIVQPEPGMLPLIAWQSITLPFGGSQDDETVEERPIILTPDDALKLAETLAQIVAHVTPPEPQSQIVLPGQ